VKHIKISLTNQWMRGVLLWLHHCTQWNVF